MVDVIDPADALNQETQDGGAPLMPLAGAAPMMTAELVADIEQQVGYLVKLRKAVVAATTVNQWKDFGGQPYLEGDGALNIASLFGLRFAEPIYETIQLPGGEVQIVCTQSAELGRRMFVDHGDCDSFDPFLSAKRKQLAEAGASPEQVLAIIITEMKKKARANAISRVVSGWTGIRGLSWDDLAALGLRREAAANISFRQGGKGAATKLVTIAEALKLPKGSKVQLRGRVIVATARSGSKGPYAHIDIKDNTSAVKVTLWAALPDWCVAGVAVFFPDAEVGEYQGQKQVSARTMERIEENQQPPAGGGDDAGDLAHEGGPDGAE